MNRPPTTVVLITICLFLIGCVSDPGAIDYGASKVIQKGDLPLLVRQSVEALDEVEEITEITQYHEYDDWFEIKFLDGSIRKFDVRGKEVFFGVL